MTDTDKADSCRHGVPYRWNCEECDATTDKAGMLADEMPPNHDEALSLAHLTHEKSNLARCYLDMALRVRALEQERNDYKADALRLHKEKMELWEAINFPGGWKERAEASAKESDATKGAGE